MPEPDHQGLTLVSFSDVRGGAAKASHALYRGLSKARSDVRLVVAEKRSGDPALLAPGPLARKWHFGKRLVSRAAQLLQITGNPSKHSLNLFGCGFVHRRMREARVLHLHWFNNDTVSLAALAATRAPLVVTLHDEWLYCGSEHCAAPGSERHVTGYVRDNKDVGLLDLDRWTWQRKREALAKLRGPTIFTGPSTWIVERARASALLRGRDVRVVPNIVDASVFQRGKPLPAASQLAESGRRVLLFGNLGGRTDPLKGFAQLEQALRLLAGQSGATDRIALLSFGAKAPTTGSLAGFPHLEVGRIHTAAEMAALYSAAHCTLVPSLVESFGLVAAESLACETPVVCFAHSGLTDIVQHRASGFLAEPFDPASLCEGITWAMDRTEDELARLGAHGRAHVLAHFNERHVCALFEGIYAELEDRRTAVRQQSAC